MDDSSAAVITTTGPPNLLEVSAGNRDFRFESGDRAKALPEVTFGSAPTPGLLQVKVLWNVTHPRWERVKIHGFKGWIPTNQTEDELSRANPGKVATFVFQAPPQLTTVKFAVSFYETSDRNEVPYTVDPGLIIKP